MSDTIYIEYDFDGEWFAVVDKDNQGYDDLGVAIIDIDDLDNLINKLIDLADDARTSRNRAALEQGLL